MPDGQIERRSKVACDFPRRIERMLECCADGKTRLVQATGDSLKSADRALRSKLADRTLPSVVIFDTRSG